MYDELVKALREPVHSLDCEFCDRKCCYPDGKGDGKCIIIQAADAIEELSHAVEQMTEWRKNQWIPVTQPPKEDGSFITAYSKGYVTQNWYMTFHHGGGKWYQNSEDTGEVTHWMPLPEPPKEE